MMDHNERLSQCLATLNALANANTSDKSDGSRLEQAAGGLAAQRILLAEHNTSGSADTTRVCALPNDVDGAGFGLAQRKIGLAVDQVRLTPANA